MPSTIAVSMTSSNARSRLPPEIVMIRVATREPRPVIVRMPTIKPAVPQATAVADALITPSRMASTIRISRALSILRGVKNIHHDLKNSTIIRAFERRIADDQQYDQHDDRTAKYQLCEDLPNAFFVLIRRVCTAQSRLEAIKCAMKKTEKVEQPRQQCCLAI
jgi:hypothetical protein